MGFLFGSFVFGVLLPLIAIVVAVRALRLARRQSAATAVEERIAALEEQVRGLLHRVWTLEQRGASAGSAPAAFDAVESSVEVPSPAAPTVAAEHAVGAEAAASVPSSSPPLEPAPTVPIGDRSPLASAPPSPPPGAAPASGPALDLEQRIGARWATWVGIIAILFAVSFFLKWTFDSELLGPAARASLGVVAGTILLLAGLALHRRRDIPYLSEGLAGLGLGVLYLSLFAAHVLYGLLGAAPAFTAMLAVTLLGAIVAVASSRQITAALTVLGGLLTPVLLRVERPDERNLLVYLLVLDFLVLAVARFRSWPALNRLAWAGSALLYAPVFMRQQEAPNPLTRVVLLTGLFLLFVAVPLLRERAEYRRIGEVDLLLVVGNAAGYFWVMYVTLERWHPLAAALCALLLAIVYRLAASDYEGRVAGDPATVMLHEGISWTFLTIAIPLALDGRWVTLAWAVQGVMLLWVGSRVTTPVAAWGGCAALIFAAVRAIALDRYWYPDTTPVWNLTYLAHLLVVVALIAGGWLARRLRPERLTTSTTSTAQSALWVLAALLLALLFWREPPGLWPATLLTAEALALGALARMTAAPALVVATPAVAAILLARVLGADDLRAHMAATSLVSRPLVSRVVACVALLATGGWLARSGATAWARPVGRVMSGAAGVCLLFALSVNWTRHQGVALEAARTGGRPIAVGEIRWRTQVGLSVLWTLYAAVALAWGFLRGSAAARYGALALFGLAVVKVFLVDLSAVRTAYRIVSFLILGVVLLLVSLLYQKARRPGAPARGSA